MGTLEDFREKNEELAKEMKRFDWRKHGAGRISMLADQLLLAWETLSEEEKEEIRPTRELVGVG